MNAFASHAERGNEIARFSRSLRFGLARYTKARIRGLCFFQAGSHAPRGRPWPKPLHSHAGAWERDKMNTPGYCSA
jgi:hypothetical protein